LRLGQFMMPLHPAGRPLHAYLAEDTEKTLLMEQLGFDELFIGEHFSAATEPYPSPLMFAASLLPRTERLVFATGVINAPLRHPALIAAEAAQFDHMSKGRFILGIGTGSTPTDIELVNVSTDPKVRARMLAEAIGMIERIWSSDPPYEFEGEFWKTKIKDTLNPELGFGWLPKPYQKPRPPIAVPVSSPDSGSVRVAGRNGWGVVSSALVSNEGLANHWRMFRSGCEEAGRSADGSNWRVCRSILVAGTDAEARARAFAAEGGHRHFFGHMHNVFSQLGRLGVLKTRPDMRDDEVTVDTFIEQRLIYGSPKTVQARLIALRQEVGPFGGLLLSTVDWGGPNAAWERESWTRLTDEVMPELRRSAAEHGHGARRAAV
jgi:alkanesulfonate monooxygenase SsuD/methylene tetrahydromethanopterin reductase-like flavin-dependent oxidoreductase (luciferase family)